MAAVLVGEEEVALGNAFIRLLFGLEYTGDVAVAAEAEEVEIFGSGPGRFYSGGVYSSQWPVARFSDAIVTAEIKKLKSEGRLTRENLARVTRDAEDRAWRAQAEKQWKDDFHKNGIYSKESVKSWEDMNRGLNQPPWGVPNNQPLFPSGGTISIPKEEVDKAKDWADKHPDEVSRAADWAREHGFH